MHIRAKKSNISAKETTYFVNKEQYGGFNRITKENALSYDLKLEKYT
jgi:hypothetical protein